MATWLMPDDDAEAPPAAATNIASTPPTLGSNSGGPATVFLSDVQIAKHLTLILKHQYAEGYVPLHELHAKHPFLADFTWEHLHNIVASSRHLGKARFQWAWLEGAFCFQLAPRLRKPGS